MKTITAPMKAHLEGEVTTLATCWKITRQDGTVHRYTEHDRDLTYNGAVYKSTGGFNKTAISSNATLAVDEMEVSGFLQDDGIADVEIRNGSFDFAQVEVFAVNYKDLSPSMGSIKLRSGWFGEVRTSDTGAFLVELRGLVDMLSTKIGRVYIQECDAEVGDDRCGISLYAQRHKAGKVYKVGNRVRYPVNAPYIFNERHYPELIDPNEPINPWHPTVIMEEDLNMTPVVGPKVLRFTGEMSGIGFSRDGRVYASDMDITNLEKNAGLYQITVTGKYYQYYRESKPWVQLKIRNGPLELIVQNSGIEMVYPERVWRDFKISAPLHPNMTEIGVRLGVDATVDNSRPSVCFDDLDIFIEPIEQEVKDYRWFGNREFVCVNQGKTAKNTPSFNTALGATTNDGGVVWEARRPQYVILTSVEEDAVDTQKIKVDTSGPGMGKASDFFRWGVCTFLTGPNRGRSMEMLSYAEDTGVIRFALPIPYKSLSGDIVVMQVGCDKRATTCMSAKFENNIVNFRGFPRMPGEGQYFKIAGMQP